MSEFSTVVTLTGYMPLVRLNKSETAVCVCSILCLDDWGGSVMADTYWLNVEKL